MGPVRRGQSSHKTATQSSQSAHEAGWPAKMASLEFWKCIQAPSLFHSTLDHETDSNTNRSDSVCCVCTLDPILVVQTSVQSRFQLCHTESKSP